MKNKEEDNRLIGPSPNEILAQGIEDIKSLSLKRWQESERKRYDELFKKLANSHFHLTDYDVTELTPEQEIALEFALNQKAKRYNRVWLWTNIIGFATVGFLIIAVSPFFLASLVLLIANIPASEGLPEFRYIYKEIHQTEDPKKLLKETKGA